MQCCHLVEDNCVIYYGRIIYIQCKAKMLLASQMFHLVPCNKYFNTVWWRSHHEELEYQNFRHIETTRRISLTERLHPRAHRHLFKDLWHLCAAGSRKGTFKSSTLQLLNNQYEGTFKIATSWTVRHVQLWRKNWVGPSVRLNRRNAPVAWREEAWLPWVAGGAVFESVRSILSFRCDQLTWKLNRPGDLFSSRISFFHTWSKMLQQLWPFLN